MSGRRRIDNDKVALAVLTDALALWSQGDDTMVISQKITGAGVYVTEAEIYNLLANARDTE